MVDAVERRDPAPPGPGRRQQRRLPVPGLGHRHRVRPEARVRAHRRQHQARSPRPRRWPTPPTTSSSRSSTRPGQLLDHAATPPPAPRSRRTPPTAIPAGTYAMQVCPFDDPTVPFTPPGSYAASVTTSDTAAPTTGTGAANPQVALLHRQPDASTGRRGHARPTRVIGCWTARHRVHDAPPGPFRNVAGLRPLGHRRQDRRPDAHDGRQQRQHPRGLGQPADAPAAPRRRRSRRPATTPTPFTDAWNNSRCDPTQLHPGGNDIDAVGDEPVRRAQPDARLLLLPRLHRGRTTTCSPTTSAAAATARRPGDRQRPGRRAHRRRAVVPGPRQRQPDRAAGRHPRHHQPVPLPADRRRLLLPLHRRRPRHGRSSATSTPTRSATA